MKKISIIVLVFFIVCGIFGATTEAAPEASVMASVNTNVLTSLIKQALPDLFAELKKVTMPGGSGKKLGVKFGIENIRVVNLNVKTFEVIADQGIIVNFSNFDIGIEGQAHYKILFFKTGRCRATADINGTSLKIKLLLSPGSNSKVNATVEVQSMNVPKAKIKLHGNFISKILQFVINLFVNIVQSSINKMKSSIMSGIQTGFNKMLEKTFLRLPISSWATMDFGLTKNVVYPNGNIIAAFDGKTIATGHENEPEEPRQSIDLSPHANLLQAKFSSFFFNSFFKAFYLNEASKSYKHLTHNDQQGFPYPLRLSGQGNTAWNKISPEIISTYGKHDMDVKMSLFSQPRVAFKPGSVTLSIDPLVSFKACSEGTKCVELFSVRGKTDISASITIARDSQNVAVIALQFTDIRVNFETVNSIVGPIDWSNVSDLTTFISDFFLKPMVNAALEKGIPLPSSDRIQFVDTQIILQQDALYFTTDLKYGLIPNPTPPAPPTPLPPPIRPCPPGPIDPRRPLEPCRIEPDYPHY